MWLSDLIGLIYPEICCACNQRLTKQEETICLHCIYSLPKTNFLKYDDNPIARHLWGRVPFEHATSMFYFTKKGRIQNLMYELKYNGRYDVGLKLGISLGAALKDIDFWKEVDVILPVPLHPKKLKLRGYNQSDAIAEGMAEAMEIETDPSVLRRVKFNKSQTQKGKLERWSNVENIFELKNAEKVKGKHVLLIDDVLTTGSTLEACAETLLKVEGLKVSIATLACAESF